MLMTISSFDDALQGVRAYATLGDMAIAIAAMLTAPVAVRRRVIAARRRAREATALARAFQSPHRPVLAQIIPTRRCNLACTYCNEYDRTSAPVPLDEMRRRIDKLVDLGTTIITLSGGEPLLHPQVDGLIRHIRTRGAIATLITNGYLLSPSLVARLNDAGLDSLQLSIDNVTPDDVSKKSLKVLDSKLELLAEQALFDVTVNTVVGGGTAQPEDALTIARRALALGFTCTAGIIHDQRGQLRPLSDRERAVLAEVLRLERATFSFDRYSRFQETLASGQSCEWHCPAGGRYLYVCEHGLVHYCSQQRGYPAIPLADYTPDDLAREHAAEKACAPHCTIGCVRRVAMVDDLRAHPVETLQHWYGTPGSSATMPLAVRALLHVFVTGPERHVTRRAAKRLFRL